VFFFLFFRRVFCLLVLVEKGIIFYEKLWTTIPRDEVSFGRQS